MNIKTRYDETTVTKPDTTTVNAVDVAAIRALYQQLMDGWNKGSAEAFAASFAEEGHLIGFDGTHLKGREEITSFHQPLFDKWLKGSRLVGQVIDVQFLAPQVALLHATGGTIMGGQSKPSPERDSIQTLVAVQRGGEWRLAAFQNTRIRPMGRNAAGTFVWLFSDWLWKLFGSNK
ncbi:MAG: SgcJ/EcaC family oxidoreductase [Anaerolineae bacterium]|jgi:uncharacterized protein (TIGR02246 family)|nr:SgcJ/EcaC family oxidoreductase [Anaerolineae bacterium]